jgi:hypothetical protein
MRLSIIAVCLAAPALSTGRVWVDGTFHRTGEEQGKRAIASMNEDVAWIQVGSILDDLIVAYDKDPDNRKIAQKPPPDPATMRIAREIVESVRIQRVTDDRANRGYRRSRARSKQITDQAHSEVMKEKRRIFDEAYRDVLHSPGEVDSRSESTTLTFESHEGNPADHHIQVGDVLGDPKLRVYGGYQHPSLKPRGEAAAPGEQSQVH